MNLTVTLPPEIDTTDAQRYEDQNLLLWKARAVTMYVAASPIVLVLGTFGNVMAILVLRKMLSNASAFPLLFLALAVTDILVLYVAILPRWIKFQFQQAPFTSSAVSCKLYMWLGNTLKTLSVWLLVAMTSQRALHIVWPIHMRRMKSHRRQAAITLAALVIFSLTLNVGTLYDTDSKAAECIFQTETIRIAFHWLDLVLNSLLPSVIMVVCNYLMIRAIVKATRRVHCHRPNAADIKDKVTSRVTLTLIVVSLVFMALTLPMHVMYIIMALGVVPIPGFVYFSFAFTNLLWLTNSAVNFYLYILTSCKFRGDVKRMLSPPIAICVESHEEKQFSSLQQTELV